MKTEKPTTGMRGFLIYDHAAQKHVFRVYESADKRKFTDYELRIMDLEVEIQGNYSSFYKDDETDEAYIDYPSRVLGKSK